MSSGTDSKIALVTGAAMGIGSAIAEHLARDGLTILVSDLDFDEADKTARRFRETGLSAQPLQLDVGQPASIDAAFGQIRERYGRCDVIVNNAGIAKTFPVYQLSPRQLAGYLERESHWHAAVQPACCTADGTEAVGPHHQYSFCRWHARGRKGTHSLWHLKGRRYRAYAADRQ